MELVSLEDTKKPLSECGFPIKQEVVDEMQKIMKDSHGIGLAAPQVGYYQRFFICDLGKGLNVCCNPKLYARRKTRWYMAREGCLTVPGREFFVKRMDTIKLRGFNQDGQPFEWTCIGRLAQVVQHEMDHLDGRCIADGIETTKEAA